MFQKTLFFAVVTLFIGCAQMETSRTPAASGQDVYSFHKYEPEALKNVIKKIEETKIKGKTPVVLFDLDDTLLNTRDRTVRILKALTKDSKTRREFPAETAQLERLTFKDVRWDLGDSLRRVEIFNPKFHEVAIKYWATYFFTNELCRDDIEIEGAAHFVRSLYDAGATVAYMTGRDSPRMGVGTTENVKKRFIYSESNPRTQLFLKEDKAEEDLVFKKRSFDKIASFGEVVGVFENEPDNLNAMATKWPNAIPVFVDSVQSHQILDRAIWVKSFSPNK